MDIEDVKKKMLKKLYETTMRDYLKHELTDLKVLAEHEGIDLGTLERVYDDFNRDGFFAVVCAGMAVEPSLEALTYCEYNGLVDSAFLDKQHEVRTGILDACFDLGEVEPRDEGAWGHEICKQANIIELEFNNNIDLLAHENLVEQIGAFDEWKITPRGQAMVSNLRNTRRIKKRFCDLKELKGVNPHQRGHALEDLLEEVIAEEGWVTKKRVHQKGVEFDIVFNRGYNYFQASCKWEKEPIEADDLDQLAMRAQEMSCVAAILVSMSGFTEGCIVRTVAKRPIQQVVLFGSADLETIFQKERRFSDLLDEKIKELKHRSKMLIDGRAR